MRTNVARGVIVVFTAVMLSGCYSNGGWTHALDRAVRFSPARAASPGSVGRR